MATETNKKSIIYIYQLIYVDYHLERVIAAIVYFPDNTHSFIYLC